jgi:hypothetical protein
MFHVSFNIALMKAQAATRRKIGTGRVLLFWSLEFGRA